MCMHTKDKSMWPEKGSRHFTLFEAAEMMRLAIESPNADYTDWWHHGFFIWISNWISEQVAFYFILTDAVWFPAPCQPLESICMQHILQAPFNRTWIDKLSAERGQICTWVYVSELVPPGATSDLPDRAVCWLHELSAVEMGESCWIGVARALPIP